MATVSDRLKNIIVETLSVEEGDVVPDAYFVDDPDSYTHMTLPTTPYV